MAVKHIQTIPGLVPSLDVRCLARAQPNDIFEARRLVRLDVSVKALAGNDVHVDQMDMNGVTPAATAVDKLPDLGGAAGYSGEHALVDHVPADAVDAPVAIVALKLKGLVRRSDGVVGDGEGHVRVEDCGDDAVVDDSLAIAGHVEHHQLVRVQVVGVGGDGRRGAQLDAFARKRRKVKDDLVPLRDADVHVFGGHGARDQAGVGGDELERDGVVGLVLEGGEVGVGVDLAKVQLEGARVARVEEAEAVLAGLDVEEGPRLAVDAHDVAVETGRFQGWVVEGSVGVELLGAHHDGDVVDAVPRRQT